LLLQAPGILIIEKTTKSPEIGSGYVRMKRNDDRGKPCLRPLPPWKKFVDSPLIKIAKFAKETHPMIQLVVGNPKPLLMRIK
jgi:hypothetical protein